MCYSLFFPAGIILDRLNNYWPNKVAPFAFRKSSDILDLALSVRQHFTSSTFDPSKSLFVRGYRGWIVQRTDKGGWVEWVADRKL